MVKKDMNNHYYTVKCEMTIGWFTPSDARLFAFPGSMALMSP